MVRNGYGPRRARGVTARQGGVCETVSVQDAPQQPECSSDADCPSGQVCQNGSCVDDPNQPQCTSDADCPQGFVCVNGSCVEDGTTEPPSEPGMSRGQMLALGAVGLGVAYVYSQR